MPKKPLVWQQARHSVEPHNKKDSLSGNGVGSLTYPSPQSVSSSFAAHRSCITDALSFEFSCEEKIGLLSFWPPFSSNDQIESNFCGSCELRHRIREVVRQRYAGRSTSSFGGSDACEFQRCFRTTCLYAWVLWVSCECLPWNAALLLYCRPRLMNVFRACSMQKPGYVFPRDRFLCSGHVELPDPTGNCGCLLQDLKRVFDQQGSQCCSAKVFFALNRLFWCSETGSWNLGEAVFLPRKEMAQCLCGFDFWGWALKSMIRSVTSWSRRVGQQWSLDEKFLVLCLFFCRQWTEIAKVYWTQHI